MKQQAGSAGSMLATTLHIPAFLLGIAVLLYIASFVVFAFIRIVTGVSIQRLGYLSLKRISYEPKDGTRIEVRKLGILFHRPTYSQPSWVSLIIADSQVTVDIRKKSIEKDGSNESRKEKANGATTTGEGRNKDKPDATTKEANKPPFWEDTYRIKRIMEKVRKLVGYMKMLDILITNATLTIVDVGSVQIGSVTISVDTRREAADRSRLFDHCKALKPDQSPLEFMLTTRSVLFTPDGKEKHEVLDHCIFNAYGVLEDGIDGVLDSAMAVKFGRINVQCDEIMNCIQKFRLMKNPGQKLRKTKLEKSLGILMEEMAIAGSRTERMAEAVMEWRVLLKSLLEGIKEIQLAIGHLVVSKRVHSVQPAGKPLIVTVTMKELGVDLHRLDQRSPAHQMYFSPKDLAHQALLAAISISINIDDGRGNVDKLVYMPMVTMTSRTTLPAKILQLVEKSDSDRNTNMLFATVVITSPSVDLEPRHLPLIMAMLQSNPKSRKSGTERTLLISRLLPKASIKFSIHEPVIRIVLPSRDPKDRGAGTMDMLISSFSSISADIEASHTTQDAHSHYSLTSALRVASHNLYYRSACGERHDLLQTETLDVRAQVHASPEVHVNVTAYLDTLIIRLVKPEIVQGIKQMATQFHRHVKPDKLRTPESSEKASFVRKLPVWLNQLKLEGRDFSVEVAGVDAEVSQTIRGAAIALDSWTIDYKCQRNEMTRIPLRRRAASRALSPEEALGHMRYMKHPKNPTDGRKMTLSLNGLECFKVEDVWEHEPFIVVPQVELSFSTATEDGGQIMSISGNLKRISLNYSLYRHYCVIVAAKVLKETFTESKDTRSAPRSPIAKSPLLGPRINFMPSRSPDPNSLNAWGDFGPEVMDSPLSQPEFISIDVLVEHIQLKGVFAQDPPMMFEAFGVQAGRQKWGFPFLRARNMRLYAASPTVKGSWARLISLRNMHLHLKESKKKLGVNYDEEKSIELDAEAIRIAIPHQLILYKVSDNVINAAKASQQMHHRLKTGTNEYILQKNAEGPKKVPRISLRTKALLFELEDDPFETQLCLIYRVGILEQKMRLAREAAFDVKVQKIRENEQRLSEEYQASRTATGAGTTIFTEHRSRFRGRTKTFKVENPSSPPKSSRSRRHRTSSLGGGGKRQMRYDPESAVGPSEAAAVSIDEARRKLNEHNSATWIRRIRWAQEQQAARVTEKRRAFWGDDEVPVDISEAEPILSLPNRPSLMTAYVHDVDLVVDKPSFPLSELSKFMYDVGKGLPEDTKFSLLLPVSIQVDFSEARILLRDYPLPFIHVPQMRSDQTTRAPSWSLRSDFVIAEELRDASSMRHVRVNIVPPTETFGSRREGAFDIDVRRTVSAVKSYSNIDVSINTGYATRITWCTSYQPAIQDMMMVFETFSKPHLDPSERTGFWDKIRLIFHSRIGLKWNGDGDVHVTLKGSRDPYKVTGLGAGFVLCLRGDVSWDIAKDEDPQKFLQIEADEFLLAIPDFSNQAKDEVDVTPSEDRSIASSNSYKEGALFKKVIMKLGGRVRVIIGLMFEQDCGGEGDWKTRKRSFEFIPHYEVTLRTPEYAKALPGDQVYDAFRGFRSQYLHLSISVISPIERDWSDPNSAPSLSYNTIHLTPKFFTHFYAWFQLFAGNMSLPIRQGALWPGPEKTAKKFGRHLATIKYQLLLSPLFISHMYMHKLHDGSNKTAATGLKVKLDSFLLDMHMRREETTTTIKGLNMARKSFGMKLNQAELDFHSADIRAVSATIDEPTVADLKQAVDEPMSSATGTIRFSGDLSQFTIPDGDYSWVDMDDFVELDSVLPSSKTPQTLIMPLAFAPRFTFFRQTDHSGPDAHGSEKPSTFGNESTHDCIMSQNNDPREIQCGLVQSRLERVHQQVKKNKQALDELAREIAKRQDDEELKEASENLIQQSSVIYDKIKFLERMLRRMSSKLEGSDNGYSSDQQDSNENERASLESEFGIDSSPFGEYNNDFDNRFIVHNMQAKWSNTLRNIIIRYIHQVNQRRGFVYYMSRRAIKFILDIVEEQGHEDMSEFSPTSEPGSPVGANDANSIESRLQQLLSDPVKFVVANDHLHGAPKSEHIEAIVDGENLAADISDDYLALNSYHVRLIAPQIQLQSDKNKSAAVLVSTQGMQLKIVSIMDKQRLGDEVSGLVQQRFSLNMDNTQFFVSHKREFVSESMWLHSANQYGAPTGSSWPPWVPLESMFDFYTSPVGFSRVVERTSATLRYDKHNSLRLKYSDQVNGTETASAPTEPGKPTEVERRVDHVWVKFPKVQASCDSSQYFAMYVIVLDLLLYTEPTEKLRSEKLEKIMLASDFSDLRGAPEMVECLQNRISQLQEIKHYFQVNARELDDKGWDDSIALANDLSNSEDELFFMMKAITTAQRRYEDKGGQSSGVLRWDISANEIIWHLLREQNDPLVDIRLDDAVYSRMDNADGSNYNTVEVAMMKGYNQLSNAVYPEMIAPFFDQYRTPGEVRQTKILRVFWHMLEAIAGIPIMDHFEVNVFPLKIQLEREIGERVFEYIFPGIGKEEAAANSTNPAVGVSPFIVQPTKIPHVGVEEGIDSSESEEERQVESPVDDRSINLSTNDKLRPTLPPRPATSYSAYKSSSAFLHTGYEKSIRSFMPSRTPTTPSISGSPKGRRSNESALPNLPLIAPTASEKRKRSLFQRSSSQGQQDKPSDELSQMMSRASNYMTLAYIKIPSVVLCLSYKGRGDRNIEDIHEFVFRMPMLEYRNKTWSNLDLALRLKKDIIKALISHTGAILENKITHHRPTKQQPNLLRMMANNTALGTTNPKLESDPSVFEKDFMDLPGDPLTIARPAQQKQSGTGESSSRSSSQHHGSTGMNSASSEDTTQSEPIPRPKTATEDRQQNNSSFHNALSRHLSQLAIHARHKEGIDGDTEESTKKKGRMLLGKKMFGS
ncbi:mitochondrial protein from FMP27-domain-containing protein [Peziza echinospora]|nr:mitochondrial protein from FMP27-domain-containing protein [Peziza echinospora]